MNTPHPIPQPNSVPENIFEIVPETNAHLEAIEALHEIAFGPGRFARAAFRVREQGDYDRALSFSALEGDTLIGSVRLTWIKTSISGSRGLLLGPLAVKAEARNKGVGRALVFKCIEAAASTDASYLMLVGDQPYYGRFGFEIAPQGKVDMPGPVNRSRLLVHPFAGFDASTLSGLVRHIDTSR